MGDRATTEWPAGRMIQSLIRVCHFGCLKGVAKPVQVLFNGIEAVVVLTFMILKQRALSMDILISIGSFTPVCYSHKNFWTTSVVLLIAIRIRLIRRPVVSCPQGPYTAHLRALVPRVIPGIVFGTRVLKWAVSGPFGMVLGIPRSPVLILQSSLISQFSACISEVRRCASCR